MTLHFKITEGVVNGECPECKQAFLGRFSCDGLDMRDIGEVELECVNCHHKRTYFWLWPHDLPDFLLEESKENL